MDCTGARRVMPAALDRELDVMAAAEFESHLQACPDCRSLYDAQIAERAALRRQATYYAAPDALRARIRSSLPAGTQREAGRGRLRWVWFNFGAALVAAVLITWTLSGQFAGQSQTDRTADEIVSAHVRSLMANHLADVASSDQHSVKPWFNGRLDFSPPVVDLTAQGFALVGGRLDYANGRPVAALVYRHRQHMINLFVWPAAGVQDAEPGLLTRQGYHLLRWTRSGMAYWAVSDLNPTELAQLRELLSAQSPRLP